jgi:ABC-type antimicrobial peptide transport system permease subunit
VLTTIGVSLVNHWVPVLDLNVVLLAVAAGTAAGACAGFWPALKATKIAPASALTH